MNVEIQPLEPREAALEQELRALAPLSPSGGLKERIRQAARDLDANPTATIAPSAVQPERRNVIEAPFWRRPGLVAAAAVLVAGLFAAKLFFAPDAAPDTHANITGDPEDELIIWSNPPKVDPSPFALKNQVLVSQENDGIVEDEHGRPVWKIRIKVLDRNSAQTNAVPVERTLFVPVQHD